SARSGMAGLGNRAASLHAISHGYFVCRGDSRFPGRAHQPAITAKNGSHPVNVCFSCPECDQPDRVEIGEVRDWQCPLCDHRLALDAADPALRCCRVCGNVEIYKKKDFPHWLGMSILVAACVLSVITYWLYQPVWTWVILIGSAAFDGLLYLCVG